MAPIISASKPHDQATPHAIYEIQRREVVI
jgi:hypothetical protein